jgi:hypothetical protein
MTIPFCHISPKIHHKHVSLMFYENVMYYTSQINSCDDLTKTSYIDIIHNVFTPL